MDNTIECQSRQLKGLSLAADRSNAPSPPNYPFWQFYNSVRTQLEVQSYPQEHMLLCIQQHWRRLTNEQRGQWYHRYSEQMRKHQQRTALRQSKASKAAVPRLSKNSRRRVHVVKKQKANSQEVGTAVMRLGSGQTSLSFTGEVANIADKNQDYPGQRLAYHVGDSTEHLFKTSKLRGEDDDDFPAGRKLKEQIGHANKKHRATESEEAYMKALLLAAVGLSNKNGRLDGVHLPLV